MESRWSIRSDLRTLFGSAARSREDTSRRSPSRGLWNSVSDRQPKATRPPCTESIVSQNDLSIVHTEKKRTSPPSDDDVYARLNDVTVENVPSMPETRLAFTSACLIDSSRVVPARYIDCINIGTLCIAFAWIEYTFFFLSFVLRLTSWRKYFSYPITATVHRTNKPVTCKFEDVLTR